MIIFCLAQIACDFAYPEVVVVNRTSEHILLKNVSFNGFIWDMVLAYDEATSPGMCLPGGDRIYFQKLDAESYCQEQVEGGTIDGVCPCDSTSAPGTNTGIDPGLINEAPNWFNYQTVSIKTVSYGSFHLFEIISEDMEQDFSVPGPYGH
ncbi:MAG: hypothetical protein V1754_10355 [Pseudomonadota bacterium]